MDPNNPVVKLCVAGMEAEGRGELEAAHRCFQQAWETRQDDFEACIAAHYLARHRATPQETHYWNQVALDHAAKVDDDRVQGFYPSLYLNLGWSHEQLGELVTAEHYYTQAIAKLDELPAGPYGDVVRRGVTAGLKRLQEATMPAEQKHRE